LRFAIRLLRQNPGFTTVAVLSLALGIGANTCIFSIVNGLMLRSLPVQDPQQLAIIVSGKSALSNGQWEHLRDHQDFLASLGAWGTAILNTGGAGELHRTWTNWVSGDYFRTLGVRPAIGRLFTAEDDRRGCTGRAVLSYDYWQRQYGGDPAIVGKNIALDGHPFEIVGVTQAGFFGMEVGRDVDAEIPLCAEPLVRQASALEQANTFFLRAVGRPKMGVSTRQMAERLAALSPRVFGDTVPPYWSPQDKQEYRQRKLTVTDGRFGLSSLRSKYGNSLTMLMAVVALVLLIACTNVANLLLARGTARQSEIAVRLAIGAGRGRLLRQLLTESALLSIMGAAGGTLLAAWGGPLLVRMLSSSVLPVSLDVSLDPRVLGLTAAVALLTGVLFGAAPAWRATSVPLNAALKERGRGVIAPPGKLSLNRLLVIVQLCLSLVLLVGAVLFMRTLRNLITVDAGFDRAELLLADLDLHKSGIAEANFVSVYEDIRARLQSLPGVESVSYANVTPISGSWITDLVKTDTFSPSSKSDAEVYLNNVSSNYFRTMVTPILAGRDFGPQDTENATPVGLINRTMAKKFFPGVNPIGKTFRQARPGQPDLMTEVIGIVKDAKYTNLRADVPATVYTPFAQRDAHSADSTFQIRFAGSLDALTPRVRDAIGGVDKKATVELKLLATLVDDSLTQERLIATLSGAFGLLALALAGIGLYGVMSYMVVRRRGEIGIRMALGAQPGSVIRLVLREVAILVGAGSVTGALAARVLTRYVGSMLYGIGADDLPTVFLAITVLAAAGVLAGYIPARKASHIDPLVALREE
jgi:putative ABC transport system permease protein